MTTTRRPDIVVGIDIGQTCSGVSYSVGPDWCEPRFMKRWPGPQEDGSVETADKVATRVAYDKTTKKLRAWGFQCAYEDERFDVREQFKLTLDADFEDIRKYSCHEAREWFTDYLACLHREIESFFDTSIPRWREMLVEFIFSTPTTWNHPAMVASIENLAKKAGFASTTMQVVRMGLTEAEAAAVDAALIGYKPGDVFLICDAGGGTTDVNLLKVKSVRPTIELQPLDYVEGVSVGSTMIDLRMIEHIERRLQLIERHLTGDILDIADQMVSSRRFQTMKESYPNFAVDQFLLKIGGLPPGQDFPEAGVRDSSMSISRNVLGKIFEEQVGKILALISGRFEEFWNANANESISYLILSGGFSNSPFLFEKLKEQFESDVRTGGTNSHSSCVMRVPDPQLAVVRGLVKERTQQLGQSTQVGIPIYPTRRCRNSYGIAIRMRYDEWQHRGLPVEEDSQGRWVENMIDWFIVKGDVIHVSDGIHRQYGATLTSEERHEIRVARIVMSTRDSDKLPQLTTDNACQQVAAVQYRLTDNDMKLQRRGISRAKYWKAEFSFVVNIGAADLRFQILGENGVISTDHDSLSVAFMDPAKGYAPPTPPVRFDSRNSNIELAPSRLKSFLKRR